MKQTKKRLSWVFALILAFGIFAMPMTGYGAENEDFRVQYLFDVETEGISLKQWFSAWKDGVNVEPETVVKLRAVEDIRSEELAEKVTWSSSNTDVAEITEISDESVTVLVKVLGETTIEAIDGDGNVYTFPLYGDYNNYAFIGSCMYYTSERTGTAILKSVETPWDGNIPEKITYNGESYTVTAIDVNNDEAKIKVETITIPKTITQIDDEWMSTFHVTGLKAIHVEAGNPKYYSVNGVLFDYYKDETGTYKRLHTYPCDKSVKRYRIPDGTQMLNENIFSDGASVKELVIPASLDLTKYNFSGLKIYDDEYNVVDWKLKLWISTKNQAAINYVKTGCDYVYETPIPWDKWYDEIGGIVELTSGVTAKLSGAYNTVQLKWTGTKPANGTMKYKVEMKKNAGKWTTISAGTTKSTLKKTKLAAGAKYTFRVTPYVVKDGKKYYGVAKTTAALHIMKKVNKPTVKKSAAGKVKVSWKNIEGETGYQISRAAKKTGTNIVATVKGVKVKSKTVKTSKGKTYYYKVRAYKTVGGKKIYGPWSVAKAYKLK